jgi:hypothetical protein
LKVIIFFLGILASTYPLKAEEIHKSPMVFEKCSNKANILLDFQLLLEKYKKDGLNYNQEYETFLSELNILEQKVRKLEKKIKENPSNSDLWSIYDTVYKNYNDTANELIKWEEYGKYLKESTQLIISKFVNLRDEISINCDGEWQIGIIRKYCKSSDEKYQQFCQQFKR